MRTPEVNNLLISNLHASTSKSTEQESFVTGLTEPFAEQGASPDGSRGQFATALLAFAATAETDANQNEAEIAQPLELDSSSAATSELNPQTAPFLSSFAVPNSVTQANALGTLETSLPALEQPLTTQDSLTVEDQTQASGKLSETPVIPSTPLSISSKDHPTFFADSAEGAGNSLPKLSTKNTATGSTDLSPANLGDVANSSAYLAQASAQTLVEPSGISTASPNRSALAFSVSTSAQGQLPQPTEPAPQTAPFAAQTFVSQPIDSAPTQSESPTSVPTHVTSSQTVPIKTDTLFRQPLGTNIENASGEVLANQEVQGSGTLQKSSHGNTSPTGFSTELSGLAAPHSPLKNPLEPISSSTSQAGDDGLAGTSMPAAFPTSPSAASPTATTQNEFEATIHAATDNSKPPLADAFSPNSSPGATAPEYDSLNHQDRADHRLSSSDPAEAFDPDSSATTEQEKPVHAPSQDLRSSHQLASGPQPEQNSVQASVESQITSDETIRGELTRDGQSSTPAIATPTDSNSAPAPQAFGRSPQSTKPLDPFGISKQLEGVIAPALNAEIGPLKEGSRVQLQLDPSNLGQIQVEMTIEESKLNVQIVAEKWIGHSIIEQHIDNLIESLDESGTHSVEVELSHRGPDNSEGFDKPAHENNLSHDDNSQLPRTDAEAEQLTKNEEANTDHHVNMIV